MRRVKDHQHGLPLDFKEPDGLIKRLGEEAARKLKGELVRLAGSDQRSAIEFVEPMFACYPELRSL
jgi:hypothetical protein